MTRCATMLISCLLLMLCGCQLKEVRSKSKFGPEFRSSGAGSNRVHNTRWTAQQGLEFKWDQGISTGLTYRRRDVAGEEGDHDNGVWFELAFPLWKAPQKEDTLARRVKYLEERLAQLESDVTPTAARTTPEGG